MNKLFKQFGLAMFVLAVFSLIFTTHTGLAAPDPLSHFAKIDGKQTVSGKNDAKVVAIVVKKEKDASGKNILYGFTSLHQFHQYLNENKVTTAAKARNASRFFEHINMKGAAFDVRVGTRINYVGNSWNDQISSIHPACTGSWTVVYQHRDFRGEALAIENSNNSCRYYFNLTNYRLSNGQSWNDQVSSIRVY